MDWVVKEFSNEELAVIERELLNSVDMLLLTSDVVFDITDEDVPLSVPPIVPLSALSLESMLPHRPQL